MTQAVSSVNISVCFAKYQFVIPRYALPVLVSFCLFFIAETASAQSSGKPRATKVAVAEVKIETITDFADFDRHLPCALVLGSPLGISDTIDSLISRPRTA